jgi:hypothetical protein
MPRKGPHRYNDYDRAHIAETAERVEARRFMVKKLGEKAVQGKDVDHIHALRGGGSNKPSNLRLRSPHANRADKTYFD